MSVVKKSVEDYQKALAAWRSAAGDYNDQSEAYNKSLQLGPDGKPVMKLLDSVKAPSGGGAAYSGSTGMQIIGYDYEHPTVTGAPAPMWGMNGQVYYTDYGVDTYAGSVDVKGPGRNTHWSAGRNPTDYKVVSAAQRVDPASLGLTFQATDENGGGVWKDADGNVAQLNSDGNGGYYTPGQVSYNPNLPGRPADFTGVMPKDPGLTLQQIKSLEQPDADQAMAVGAMGDSKGTVAQRYGKFDNEGEEGLVARAIKGFKKE